MLQFCMTKLTSLFDQIAMPEDLRLLDRAKLSELADEVRADMIEAASKTGGHFGARLDVCGIVEAAVGFCPSNAAILINGRSPRTASGKV